MGMNNNFVFYGSWKDLLDGFPHDVAAELAYQIVLMGTTGECTSDDPMIKGIIEGAISPNVKAAKKRYEEAVEVGKKGGRPKKEMDLDVLKQMRDDGKSLRELGEYFGVSKDTISRRLAQIEKRQD